MTKKHRGGGHGGGHGNSERWLLTYADLITLLTALFIVLWAMSYTDTRKLTLLGASLAKAFNVGVLSGNDATSIASSAGSVQSGPTFFLNPTQKQDFQVITQKLSDYVKTRDLAGQVDVHTSDEGTVISISGTLLFPSGRAEIRPEGAETLAAVADIIRPLPNKIRVDGHTDDLPPSPALFASNWDLAAARALSVVKYLNKDAQIAPNRLSAASYGEFNPIAPNDSVVDRMKNRRADIVILYSSIPQPEDAKP